MADTAAPNQGLTEWQRAELAKGLEPNEIKYLDEAREQPYVPTYHTIHELNRVFGFGGWESEIVDMSPGQEWPYYKVGYTYQSKKVEPKAGILVAYRALVRLTIHTEEGTRSYMGCGMGTQVAWNRVLDNPDSCDHTGAHVTAIKGAESDALKRAARHLGDRFGLNLSNKGDRPAGNGGGKVQGQPAASSAAQSGAGGDTPNLDTFPGFLNAMLNLKYKGRAAINAFAAGIGYVEAKLEELGPEDWVDIYGAALRERDAG